MTPTKPGHPRSLAIGLLATAFLSSVCLRAESSDRNADALLASGISLSQQERYIEAAEVFRQCIAIAPERFEAHYDLALALFALQRFSESRQVIAQVQPRNTTETAARNYAMGKVDAVTGDKQRAREELSAAFTSDPADENYAIDYGFFLLRAGEYQTAITVLTRAANVHPRSIYVLLGLAMAQAFGGKRDDAVRTCERVLHEDAQFSPALLVMAWAHYMSGDYAKAEQASARGLLQPSAAPYLYYVHTAALLKLDSTSYAQMDAELRAAERAIPMCTLCYFAHSKVHEAAGEISAAMTDLESIVTRLAPDFYEAWYRLAKLYERQGNEKQAREALAHYRAIQASHADAELDLARDTLLGETQK